MRDDVPGGAARPQAAAEQARVARYGLFHGFTDGRQLFLAPFFEEVGSLVLTEVLTVRSDWGVCTC